MKLCVRTHTHTDIKSSCTHSALFGWWLTRLLVKRAGVSTTPSSVWGKTTTTISYPNQQPRERVNIHVCVWVCVHVRRKKMPPEPPTPPASAPSPNHNKPETNSKRGCKRPRVWITLLLKIVSYFIFFLLPRGKTDHLQPCKLDNIPSKKQNPWQNLTPARGWYAKLK